MEMAAVLVGTAMLAMAQTSTLTLSGTAVSTDASNSGSTSGVACTTDADCLGSGGSCYFGNCTVIINCSLATLGQCGNSFATAIKQPLIIGLVILGVFVLLCCLPSILCCFFRKLFCFAIKAPVRVVGASAKAVSAVSNMDTIKRTKTRTDRTLPRNNSNNNNNVNQQSSTGNNKANLQKTRFSTYNPYSAYKNKPPSANGRDGVAAGRAKQQQYAKLNEVTTTGGTPQYINTVANGPPSAGASPRTPNGSNPRNPNNGSGPRYPPTAAGGGGGYNNGYSQNNGYGGNGGPNGYPANNGNGQQRLKTPAVIKNNTVQDADGGVCAGHGVGGSGGAKLDSNDSSINDRNNCRTFGDNDSIIGLIAGGAVFLVVIIPGLICCCVKRLLCFAVRIPGKAVSAAFSAAAAGTSSSNTNDSSYKNNKSSQQQQQQRNYGSKNINGGGDGSRPLQNRKKEYTQFNDVDDDGPNNSGLQPYGGIGSNGVNPPVSAYKPSRSQPYPQPPNTSKHNYQPAINQQQQQQYGNESVVNNAAYAYPTVNVAAAAAATAYTPASGQLYYGMDPNSQNFYAQQQYMAQGYNGQQYNPYETQQQIFQQQQQQQQYQPRFIPYDPSQQQQPLLQQQQQQQSLSRQPSTGARPNPRQPYQQPRQQQQQAAENDSSFVQPTENPSRLPRKLNEGPTATVAGVAPAAVAAPRAPTHPRVAVLALAAATANVEDLTGPDATESPHRGRFDSDSSGTSADGTGDKQQRGKRQQQQVRVGSPSSGGVIARGSAGAVFLPPPPPESPDLSVANRARARDGDDTAADIDGYVNVRGGRPSTTNKQLQQRPKQRSDRAWNERGEKTTGAVDDSDSDLLSNYIDEDDVVVHEDDVEEIVVEPRRPAAGAAGRRPRRQSLLESEARKQRLEMERIEEEAMRARGGINAGSGGFSPAITSTSRSNLYRSSSDGSASTSRRAAAAANATGRSNINGQWASDVLDGYDDDDDLNDSPFGQKNRQQDTQTEQQQVQRIPGRTPAIPLFKPVFQEPQQQQQQQQQRPQGISSRELARQQLQRERDSAAIAAAAAAALIKRASRDLTIRSDSSDNPANDTSTNSRRTSSNKRLSREYVKEASVGFAHRLHVANKRASRELIATVENGGVTGRERAMKRISYEFVESSGNSSRRDSGSGNYSRAGGAGGSSRERGKRMSSDAGSGSAGASGSDRSAVANALFEEYAWMGGRQGLQQQQQQQQQGGDRGRAPIQQQQQQRQQQSGLPTGQISVNYSGGNETSLSPAHRRVAVVGDGVDGGGGGGNAEGSLSPRRRAPTGDDGDGAGGVDRNRNRW
ncbi:hypothetical protein HK100_001691 [Physocladia obscura]|uniref:Uncharacterized protein n=1 Tax=Physocladia obscura TaxID=109957 RepID=A0AAD5XEC1_9FUNG|nr:hypothetical protein HK100_001691 [Physocladia obscura]